MLAPPATVPLLARFAITAAPVQQTTPAATSHLDALMLLNFLGIFAALVCYFEMRRSNAMRLAFEISLAALAICGFMQGTWALSIVAALWCFSSVRQWKEDRQFLRLWNKPMTRAIVAEPAELYSSESRITRLFGAADVDQERWNSAS